MGYGRKSYSWSDAISITNLLETYYLFLRCILPEVNIHDLCGLEAYASILLFLDSILSPYNRRHPIQLVYRRIVHNEQLPNDQATYANIHLEQYPIHATLRLVIHLQLCKTK